MRMRRDLRDGQGDFLRATGLGESGSVALMNGETPAEIGQGERRFPVAAVGGADQLEKRLVLGDRQQLALTEHPTRRGEVPSEHPELAHVWLRHCQTSFNSAMGRCPAVR